MDNRRYDDYGNENFNGDGGRYGDRPQGQYPNHGGYRPQYPPQGAPYPPQGGQQYQQSEPSRPHGQYPPQGQYPPPAQPYQPQYPPQGQPYPGDGFYRGEGVMPLGGDEGGYEASPEEKKRRGLFGMFRRREESVTGSDGSNIIITYPRSHHDIRVIIDNLRRRQAIIVDLSRMPDRHAQRILDFLSGAIYALCGSQQRIGPNMFLLTPGGMSIQVPMDIKKKYD
mgnify:FL=1